MLTNNFFQLIVVSPYRCSDRRKFCFKYFHIRFFLNVRKKVLWTFYDFSLIICLLLIKISDVVLEDCLCVCLSRWKWRCVIIDEWMAHLFFVSLQIGFFYFSWQNNSNTIIAYFRACVNARGILATMRLNLFAVNEQYFKIKTIFG